MSTPKEQLSKARGSTFSPPGSSVSGAPDQGLGAGPLYKRFTIIMAFKPEKFAYQPLQEPMDFRLLELLPGERDETLKCSLTHSSLTSHPYYYAVSYTWGTPGLFQEIKLGGVAHSIQANLFDFLQQLRLTYAAVTLWVDALCINQNDILEKNIQVPLMGLIYSIF